MTRHTNAIGMGQADDSLRRGDGRVGLRWMQSLLSLALVVALALPLGLLVPGAAQARIDRSDFLSKRKVKVMTNITLMWGSSTRKVERSLGAKPARCRSDIPFGAYREARSRCFAGDVRGLPSRDHRGVETGVYRYSNKRAARNAMHLLKRYATDCPRTVEWVCTQCDGISTSWRKPVVTRRVGKQSTAWRLRIQSDGKFRGYVIVARKGRTIVKTEVRNMRLPGGRRFPKAPPKSMTVAVAKAALREAT